MSLLRSEENLRSQNLAKEKQEVGGLLHREYKRGWTREESRGVTRTVILVIAGHSNAQQIPRGGSNKPKSNVEFLFAGRRLNSQCLYFRQTNLISFCGISGQSERLSKARAPAMSKRSD